MNSYLEKYASYTEKFSNNGANNTENNSIKCYSCVGDWPNRNCYPVYKEEDCVNGTFEDYDSCAQTCGTSFNRPANNTHKEVEEVEEVEEVDNKVEEVDKEVEEEENTISKNELNNKINKALNNKLKNSTTFNQNATNSDLFDNMNKLYKNYVKALPYDVPKTFSLSIFLMIVISFTVCNIVLSFYGAKSIASCGGKNVLMIVFTSLFLIFSWLGHMLPYYGNLAALISMIVTIILVLVSGSTCK